MDSTLLENSTSIELREPPMYEVILLNDNYTTAEFVISILRIIFNKSEVEATELMWDVHKKGKGVAGIYTYDIATTKIFQVQQLCKLHKYPLRLELKEI